MTISRLSADHHYQMLTHLLALGQSDRRLRFCASVSDEFIIEYCTGINFTTDVLFGQFTTHDHLISLCHLAAVDDTTSELAISISEGYRQQGHATALFNYALQLTPNSLVLNCLPYNEPMKRIAMKAGIPLCTVDGETSALITRSNPST